MMMSRERCGVNGVPKHYLVVNRPTVARVISVTSLFADDMRMRLECKGKRDWESTARAIAPESNRGDYTNGKSNSKTDSSTCDTVSPDSHE